MKGSCAYSSLISIPLRIFLILYFFCAYTIMAMPRTSPAISIPIESHAVVSPAIAAHPLSSMTAAIIAIALPNARP